MGNIGVTEGAQTQGKDRPVRLHAGWPIRWAACRRTCGLYANEEYALKYSATVDWKTIKHARTALTAMAVQLCALELIREQRRTVTGAQGLHGSAIGAHGHREISWSDIGSHTIGNVQKILSRHQPLATHLIQMLASPRQRHDEAGVLIVRKSRPPSLVCIPLVSTFQVDGTTSSDPHWLTT